MNQLGLFDAPITRGGTRKTSRQTSVDAARTMSGVILRDQQRKVLQVVEACAYGATAFEVAVQLGLQQNVMAKRLSELGEMGLTFRRTGQIGSETVCESRPGGSGRRCDVWRVTGTGRARLAGVVDVQVVGYL